MLGCLAIPYLGRALASLRPICRLNPHNTPSCSKLHAAGVENIELLLSRIVGRIAGHLARGSRCTPKSLGRREHPRSFPEGVRSCCMPHPFTLGIGLGCLLEACLNADMKALRNAPCAVFERNHVETQAVAHESHNRVGQRLPFRRFRNDKT